MIAKEKLDVLSNDTTTLGELGLPGISTTGVLGDVGFVGDGLR